MEPDNATARKRQDFERFVERKVAHEPSVVGIAVVGSVAAGTARGDSDVDAVVFIDPLDLYVLPAEAIWRASDDTFHSIFSDVVDGDPDTIQLDLKRLDWATWSSSDHVWPEPMRGEIARAWIALDRDGRIRKLIEERTRYGDELRLERLDEAITQLDQLLAEGRPELTWSALGPLAAHDRLNAAWEYLVQGLFAYNRQWRTWRSREATALQALDWLPNGFSDQALAAVTSPTAGDAGYLARVNALRRLATDLRTKLTADGVYRSDPVGEAFVRRHDEPGRAWNIDSWNERHRTRS